MIPDLRIVKFQGWHLTALLAQGAPAEGSVFAPPDRIAPLENENSWTALVGVRPIACGGTMQFWPGRHLAWAYLARGCAPYMRGLTQAARDVLALATGRLEADIRVDFRAGQRWAKRLGFVVETPLKRAFGPDGADYVGMVRV